MADASHRWNVEDTGGGRIRICRGYHDKSVACQWEDYSPDPPYGSRVEATLHSFVPDSPHPDVVRRLDLPESAACKDDYEALLLRKGDRVQHAMTAIGGKEIHVFSIIRK